MVKDNKVGCHRVLGKTICHFGSAMIIPRKPVTIDVYTSQDCQMCKSEIKKLGNKLKRLKGFVKMNVVDIEKVDNLNLRLLGTLPVLDFKNGVVERGNVSKMNEGDILGRIVESARNGEWRRSISN